MSHEFKQFTPTAARGSFKEEYYADDNGWSAEPKLDGDRRIAQFLPEGTRFTGRRISEKDGLLVEKTLNLPHLNAIVPELCGTVLDGEIIHPSPGARSNLVARVMGSLPERAIKVQKEHGWLEYHVFDCLFYKGQDLREASLEAVRRVFLNMAVKEWENPYAKRVVRTKTKKVEFLHHIWSQGGEGIILKRDDSRYDDHLAWVKVKKEITEDVVILGYDPPNEESTKVNGETSITRFKENGWIGAIQIGQYDESGELKNMGSVSGMKDTMRAEFSRCGDKYWGMVIEVQANEREPSGRFRHGRFIRLRPDKGACDCIWRK